MIREKVNLELMNGVWGNLLNTKDNEIQVGLCKKDRELSGYSLVLTVEEGKLVLYKEY